MKIVKIDYKNPDPKAVKKVADAINKGKIAIVPGDAVYTMVGDAFNLKSIKKVQKEGLCAFYIPTKEEKASP